MRIPLTNGGQKDLQDFPDHCPFCHRKISPQPVIGHSCNSGLEVFMWCPSSTCNQSFIAYYDWYGRFKNEMIKGTILGTKFSDSINNISPSFSVIYNQASYAEQENLLEICGVGYRKALEFLVKDYAKSNHPGKEQVIEGKLLAQCIGDFVTDDRIKGVAKRAAWLGNDETHYVRKWEGKNLEDLKKLIGLTIHWIEMEELTKSFQNDMPE